MNLHKFLVVFFLTLLMAMQGASAADSPTPENQEKVEAGGFFDSMDGAIREFARKAGMNLSQSMAKTGHEIADKIKTTALSVGGALALVYLLYEVMQFLSGRTKSMLVVLFDVGIPCVFAAILVTQYAFLMEKFEGVLNVFRTLGMAGENPVSKIMLVYGSVFDNITKAIGNAFGEVGGMVQFVKDPTKFMVSWVDLFATLFFTLVILALLLMGVAEVLGLLLIAPFLFAVGVAFGPIMIAGIVTPWTRDYFSKWLQFLVISAGLQGVINVIFIIAFQLMETLQVESHTSNEPTAVSLVIICVLLLTINSMVSQAPSIASALFPGHVGVSKSAAGDAKNAVSKGASMGKQALSKGTVGGATVVAKTIRNVAGFSKRMGQGKTP